MKTQHALAALLAVCLCAVAACATTPYQDEGADIGDETFAAWDADGDGLLDAQEFSTGLDERAIFASWDVDDDGGIDAQELDTALMRIGWSPDPNPGERYLSEWDLDGDGMLSDAELGQGLYEAWDEDDDGDIGVDEFEGLS